MGYLARLAAALHEAKLEAILIGNGAAALQGARVTTVDLDFCYCANSVNQKKLQVIADFLRVKLTQPFPTLSSMYRLDFGLDDFYVDFLSDAGGIRSLASLRSRATPVALEGKQL
jgi:hypothetical protein